MWSSLVVLPLRRERISNSDRNCKASSRGLDYFLDQKGEPVQGVVLRAIKLYQVTLSQAGPPTCRYVPSCSHYGYEAVSKYGAGKGVWLALKRIARCHPFQPGGYDPVP